MWLYISIITLTSLLCLSLKNSVMSLRELKRQPSKQTNVDSSNHRRQFLAIPSVNVEMIDMVETYNVDIIYQHLLDGSFVPHSIMLMSQAAAAAHIKWDATNILTSFSKVKGEEDSKVFQWMIDPHTTHQIFPNPHFLNIFRWAPPPLPTSPSPPHPHPWSR